VDTFEQCARHHFPESTAVEMHPAEGRITIDVPRITADYMNRLRKLQDDLPTWLLVQLRDRCSCLLARDCPYHGDK